MSRINHHGIDATASGFSDMAPSQRSVFKRLRNAVSGVRKTTIEPTVRIKSVFTLAERRSGRIINEAWRQYRQHVRETANQHSLPEAFRSTHPNLVGIKNIKIGDVFYCSKDGKEGPFHLLQYDPTLKELSGAHKEPYGANRNAFLSRLEYIERVRYDEFAPHMRDLKTIIGNTRLNKTFVIAPNAGQDLFRLAKEGKLIEMAAFKEAANDLKKLHEKRILPIGYSATESG